MDPQDYPAYFEKMTHFPAESCITGAGRLAMEAGQCGIEPNRRDRMLARVGEYVEICRHLAGVWTADFEQGKK